MCGKEQGAQGARPAGVAGGLGQARRLSWLCCRSGLCNLEEEGIRGLGSCWMRPGRAEEEARDPAVCGVAQAKVGDGGWVLDLIEIRLVRI